MISSTSHGSFNFMDRNSNLGGSGDLHNHHMDNVVFINTRLGLFTLKSQGQSSCIDPCHQQHIMRINCWPQLLGFAWSRPSAAVNIAHRSLKSAQLSAPAWPRAESSPCARLGAGVPPHPASPAPVSSFHNLLLPFLWFGDNEIGRASCRERV